VVGSAAGTGLAMLFRNVQHRLTRQVDPEDERQPSSGRYLTFVFAMIVVSHALRLLTLRLTHPGEKPAQQIEDRTTSAL
jgi:hypothetical protein